MARALLATALVVALFFAGQPPAKAAIVVGALLLLTRRVKSARVYAEIDWSLLLMFTGLFIIVAGAERELLTPQTIEAVGRLHLATVPVLSIVTAVLSNLVSNVPAVLLLKPFVAALPDHDRAWLVIAMAVHAGRQLHRARLDRQPDRGGEGGAARRRDRLLGLFPRRRTADGADAAAGNVVADVALSRYAQEVAMDRIRVLEESLWAKVPADVIEEAKQAARDRAELDRDAGQWPCRRDGAAGQSGHRDRRCDLYRRGQPGAARLRIRRGYTNHVSHRQGVAGERRLAGVS